MINEELEKNYNQKIKELAMKNKDINVYFSTDWLFYRATLSYAKL